MDETIQTLSGSEEKSFSTDLDFSVTVGAVFQPARSLLIRGDATLLPYDQWKGIKIGIALKILYLL